MQEENQMALKKQYSRDGGECKVTFTLPREVVANFSKISLKHPVPLL
jgi:hypothetical protein